MNSSLLRTAADQSDPPLRALLHALADAYESLQQVIDYQVARATRHGDTAATIATHPAWVAAAFDLARHITDTTDEQATP